MSECLPDEENLINDVNQEETEVEKTTQPDKIKSRAKKSLPDHLEDPNERLRITASELRNYETDVISIILREMVEKMNLCIMKRIPCREDQLSYSNVQDIISLFGISVKDILDR